MRDELTKDELIDSYARSLGMTVPDQVETLSALQFAGHYDGDAPWAVGPFEVADELTFVQPTVWTDPTGIGWRNSAVLNPTLLPDGPLLHLFYRASPRKETLDSRIGHAVYDARAGAWSDDPVNPIIYPTRANEAWGCEDPKVYRGPDGYYLFYNGAWGVDDEDRAAYGSEMFSGEVGCDINLAVSDDLRTWRKLGPVVPHEVSRLWAKAAVILRDGQGNAVPINGEYLMFLSEGCGGALTIGRSTDLRIWRFEAVDYLDVSEFGVLHEVATALLLPGQRQFVVDFFAEDSSGTYVAGQALFDVAEPFRQRATHRGGTLAWGGIVEWEGHWLFAQGWDAPDGVPEMTFYRAPLNRRPDAR